MRTVKKLTTNTQLIKGVLTRYKNTFFAFCELINNSLQATAKKIEIMIDYQNSIGSSGITKITLKDNGYGVPYSEFEERILNIGTTVKTGGHGIGRFGALQIGSTMEIETVAYDPAVKKYSLVRFVLTSRDLNSSTLDSIEFDVDYDYFDNRNPYYQITIKELFNNSQETINRKNQLVPQFSQDNIKKSIFERYPLDIFNNDIKFSVNGEDIKKEDYLNEKPTIRQTVYTDKKGTENKIDFFFYNIKLTASKVKVFFCVENASLQTVAHEYTYSSDWYTPDLGTWYIYLNSTMFNSDLFRNLDMDTLGEEEIRGLKDFIKEIINNFFKAKNKRFEKFVVSLEMDRSYPYLASKPASESQEILFKKVAYLIEDEYQLIKKNERIREIIYPLVDRALENGSVEYVFRKLIKLSDSGFTIFESLLERTDIEDVVHFASKVAQKIEFLDFLQELAYGEISKVLKERSQLHKIIEKELWLFGEAYNEVPQLWSDKKIGNILDELHSRYFNYKPTDEDENLIVENIGENNITDLFFLNEKITDDEQREIMVVELKSPSCAINRKELQQIDDYAYTIATYPSLPINDVKYKLILISSKIAPFAESKIKAARTKYNKPFLYDIKTEKNIEVYVLSWSELIEINKRKLGYLSSRLNVKDKSVKTKFEEEYAELIDEKVSARLTRIKG